MRHQRHIHPEELMNPDLLSEILLIGSILLVVAFFLLILMHISDYAM